MTKRLFDLLFSFLGMVVLSPLFLIVSLFIISDSKGGVFYCQKRVGKNNKDFNLIKFRTMMTGADNKGLLTIGEQDHRITKTGRWLRKYKLDELPQLINILKGEMSFVGPRPEREHFVKQLAEIIPYYGQRFSVKPGLTGWAQVSYGYGASVRDAIEKLNYDLFYIKNMSILMDIMIVARTLKTVLFGKGR